ncbi:uncharacterized protein LOC112143483 [Oryzias melastigma]|uniref:uncharacterized protein LOC112143483 n=1 Tax=Oryzias melastigma TaxID=30732 RepID=UPI00168CD9B3|nr:uncharacterized protein LOC112143483 [Oryzias melastigma]
MESDENLKLVDEHLNECSKLLNEFIHANEQVLKFLPDDEKDSDQELWFQPKKNRICELMDKAEKWKNLTQQNYQEDVSPDDSVSVTDSKVKGKSASCVSGSVISGCSSRSSRVSSVSSARHKAQAERAALLARAASLKQRQALDIEECKLKTKREQLEIETAIAESTAKIKVLEECEHENRRDPAITAKVSLMDNQLPHIQIVAESHQNSAQLNSNVFRSNDSNTIEQLNVQSSPVSLCEVMLKQNDITEMLVKQQKQSQLPQRDVPVFSGDPLEFQPFIRAFDHTIHDKTDSDTDRLYYLELFTRGEPRDLVRSCQHMNSQHGYPEARKLLNHHYGNELKIATAYMNRAFNWPQIKPDDSKALQSYSLFLTGCNNAMQDICHLQELDHPTNLRIIVSKLPYKMREMWRVSAFDIQEATGRRAKFSDLAKFVNRQAKIATDPVFGDIKGSEDKAKPYVNEKINRTSRLKGSSFATSVVPAVKEKCTQVDKSPSPPSRNPFQQPCLYCEKQHALSDCYKIRNKPHSERLEFLKENGLCFGCLTPGHLSKYCKKRASCDQCPKKHPTMLHFSKDDDDEAEKNSQKTPAATPSSELTTISSGTCGATGAGKDNRVLSIVPVYVKLKKGSKAISTYAFLDNGSQATFCSEKLMRQLGIEGRKTHILLRTMGQEKLTPSYHLSGLQVCGLKESLFIDLPDIYTHSDIPVSKESIPLQQDLERWPHLHGVQLPKIQADVGLLIGCDVYKAMEPWDIIHSVDNGPYAVRTVLGWVINGPLRDGNVNISSENDHPVSVNRISIATVEDLLMQQFNHDFPEKASEEKQEMSWEDIKFMNSVNETCTKVDGHYSIGLPLRNKNLKMPNNRCVVVQRAENLRRKLIRNEDFYKEYKKFISDLLAKGYAVEVQEKDSVTTSNRNNNRVWYIPHHGVYHPQKKKLRVVFDCASSYQGVSLNAELMQGPDLTNSLLGVLTRFRHDNIALMSDVEAMYHQVRVPPEDSDLLRFLWWPEGNINQPLQDYKMVVHLFGATSSPSCANFALKKTAEDAKSLMAPAAVNAIMNNFYVDDCLISVSDGIEACNMVNDLTELCESGGFHLTKWMTNDRAVLASIPEKERAKEVKDLDLSNDPLPDEKVLGVNWCAELDQFKVSLNPKSMPHTRRGILSFVSAMYDPLGFLSPVILPAKMILQELCCQKISWDENIPPELEQRFLVWLSDLARLDGFAVNRCLKPVKFGKISSAQLHHFADASERGYGVVTYLRMKNDNLETHCSFIIGKSRVSPLKQMTIPRLELTAATVAVKMDKLMNRELQIPLEQSVFWTDSTTVLKYIASENIRFKTFVANRVSFIRENTEPNQWMYVNSELNPADHASRGLRADSFIKCQEWINGPDYLTRDKKYWPVSPDRKDVTDNDVEIKRQVNVNATNVSEDLLNKLICHYSEWHKLKRAVSWFLILKQLLLKISRHRKDLLSQVSDKNNKEMSVEAVDKQMQKFKSAIEGSLLTADDVAEGELEIIKYCQRQHFSQELLALQKDAKHPVILPKDHHVSTLILRGIHQETGHSGRNYTLSRLREKFWIPQADSAIRKILSKCVTCKRVLSKPGQQRMANLPQDRLVPDKPPFSNVGIDYFGPFDAKCGRSTVKRYGVLFTCLTVRAIHIEVAHSLDTDSCINAIRRFIARRGQVSILRSDNGTNLVGAEKEMREAIKNWNHAKISETLVQKNITWIFNPPAGSHFGGIWERQIRSVRRILNQTLKQQTLDDELLQTFFCEVEAIVNGRPITRVSNDINDLEALTPNHLLLLKGQPHLPPGIFCKDDLYARRRWKQIQYLSDIFWKRWTKEYLPLLQERQKWFVTRRNLKCGDVVLIVDDSAPRNSWLMGKVEKTVSDSNGLVRRVFVRTKSSVLERPVTKLCLLLEMDE